MENSTKVAPSIKAALMEIEGSNRKGLQKEYPNTIRKNKHQESLSTEAVNELISYRKWARALNSRDLTFSEKKYLTIATEQIVSSVYGLIINEISEIFAATTGINESDKFTELLDSSVALVLEKIETFDQTKGFCFSTYAISCVRPFLKGEKAKNDFAPEALINPIWRKVSKVAYIAQVELTHELNREPTLPEIQERTKEKFYKSESGSGKNYAENEKITMRLKKSGVLRALNEDFSLVMGVQNTLSLDVKNDDGQDLYEIAESPVVQEYFEENNPDNLLQLVVPEIGNIPLTDYSNSETYGFLGGNEKYTQNQIRKIFKERVVTPHAQWLMLGPGPNVGIQQSDFGIIFDMNDDLVSVE